jgi:hypothetical protein
MVPAIHIYAQPRHVGRNYIVHPARMTTMKILLSHTIEKEIHELKNNVDLNKKTFRQLVLGKIGDIVINETGSQVAAILKIVTLVYPIFTRLLLVQPISY